MRPPYKTPDKIKESDFSPMVKLINECYEGNLMQMVKWLDRTIYMLHFLPEGESFSEMQRHNTCYTLLNLRESLLEIHFNRQEWYFAPFDYPASDSE